MTWLVRIFFGFAGLAIVLIGVGALLPAHARLERTITIGRPAATVYTLVSDLRVFEEWSPWEDEVGAVGVYSGAERGVGQSVTLTRPGTSAVAAARWITSAQPHRHVVVDMTVGARGRARETFDIAGREGGASLTWGYDRSLGLNILARYGWVLIHRRGLEHDFDAGLTRLRDLAETLPGADFSDLDAAIVTVSSTPVVYVQRQVRGDRAQQRAAFEAAAADVRAAMASGRVRAAGPVIADTLRWEPPLWEFRSAIPYQGPVRTGAVGGALFGETHEGRAVRAIHRGDPGAIARLYPKLDAFTAAHRLTALGGPWEMAVEAAADAAGGEHVTEIYLAVE